MQIGRIAGATRVIGKSQGYLGLPLRDELIEEGVNGPDTPCMVTAWHPTPDEIERLINGAAVHVRILGTVHPPLIVEVGEAPSEDEPAPEAVAAPASLEITVDQAVAVHNRARSQNQIMVWVVTHGTKDFGCSFVARPHLIADGQLLPLDLHLIDDTLVELREALRPLCLGWFGRRPDDDPVIVEWWV